MAHLVLKPSIKVGSTIAGYVVHVKYGFRAAGCEPSIYDTAFLRQVKKGVEKSFPSGPDKRQPFLLPQNTNQLAFLRPTKYTILSKVATIPGFIAMLRPHTFSQLSPSSFTFVLQDETCVPGVADAKLFNHQVRSLLTRCPVLGFYIDFKSKTMSHARAYLPNLSSPPCRYSSICPVSALLSLAGKDMIKVNFLKKAGTGKKLGEYLQSIMNSDNSISPYALRIGGRTWYLSRGMDRQFTDYLGTWKSPQASARYFRARPGAVLKICRRFFYKQQDPREP